MGDAVMRRLPHGGLGVESDAEPGIEQHRQVVGAVAQRQRGAEGQAARGGGAVQALALAGLVENRLDHPAGEFPLRDFQLVGFLGVEPDGGGDTAGEEAETARHEQAVSAAGFHGLHQRARAGHEGDVGLVGLLQGGFGQVLQQGDAFAQRGLEIELAVHGALGDGRDMGFEPDEPGQLIDAFLLDHGGIHIGDQQAFFTAFGRLENEIERGAGEAVGQRPALGRVRRARQEDVGGQIRFEPFHAMLHRPWQERLGNRLRIEAGTNYSKHMGHKNEIAVVMGPTGSGKSALALAVAASRPAVIINADAMQMVDAVPLLTAQPSAAEKTQAEHVLYGVLAPQEPTSVARWLGLVVPVIERAWAEAKLPLLVGGTGMYLKALKEGLAAVPPIPEALRATLRAMDPVEVRAALEARDPAMAAQLKPGDRQRNLRALEVLEATGRSLADWQGEQATPPLPGAVLHEFYIEVPKPVLYPRLDARFDAMMAAGALEEVRALLAIDLPPENPITRATGVPELAAYLRGEVGLAEAVSKAKQHTRNYAKRQQTWIRNQLNGALALDGSDAGPILIKMSHSA